MKTMPKLDLTALGIKLTVMPGGRARLSFPTGGSPEWYRVVRPTEQASAFGDDPEWFIWAGSLWVPLARLVERDAA